MSYWQLFYHLVWTTKYRAPILTDQVKPVIYEFLRMKAVGLGATLFALNGIEDHVHMVVSIPPKIAVAKFVGQVKAVSSVKYNQLPGVNDSFYWQEEYGAFSFDGKRLPHYIQYVEKQEEHHANNSIIPVLERFEGAGVKQAREPEGIYEINDGEWADELLDLEMTGS